MFDDSVVNESLIGGLLVCDVGEEYDLGINKTKKSLIAIESLRMRLTTTNL